MAENRLTVKQVDNAKLEAGEREMLLRDGNGLELRVTKSGKYWQFRYLYQGRRRVFGMNQDERERDGLATISEGPLSAARRWRAWCRLQLAHDIDPADARASLAENDQVAQREKAEQQLSQQNEFARLAARTTFLMLFNQWVAAHVNNKKGGAETIRRITKDALPIIGHIFAEEVTRQMIANIVRTVSERGARRSAYMLLGEIRQCYQWGVSEGLLEPHQDPTIHMDKKKFGDPAQERERILNEDELKYLLQTALPNSNLSFKANAAIRVLLATTARVGELLRAKRNEVDLVAREWLIPSENAKNSKPHLIHLSEFAVTAFLDLIAIPDHPEWIFPNRSGSNHVCVKTLTKQIGDRQREDNTSFSARSKNTTALIMPRGKWTAHDLRRTAATLMGELGVRPDVIDRCQNHIEQKRVTRTYQRQELLLERKKAFLLLGAKLSSIGVQSAQINPILPT